jgi:hypothetical protein
MKDLMHICNNNQLIKKELSDYTKKTKSIFSEPSSASAVDLLTLKILPFLAPVKGELNEDEIKVSNKGKKKTEKEESAPLSGPSSGMLLTSII